MKIALLGYPQSGKKTLFHLLTGRSVPEGRKEAESIEGVARIRDVRVDAIAAMVRPNSVKYAENVFVLCPDIDPGKTERHWLEAARRCDLLCVLVRAFESESVYHPKGAVDAARDRRDLETEFLVADLEMVENRLARIAKEKRGGRTVTQQIEEKALEKCLVDLNASCFPDLSKMDATEVAALRGLGLMTLKPVLWAHNVGEGAVREGGDDPVTVSCRIEEEIMTIEDPVERKAFLADIGLESSGLDRVNAAAYSRLGLMSFYTMGPDEVRAWTIRRGALAPAAAGKIHSDMERGFIRVEVIKYDDLMALGSESAVKDAGKSYLKGKDYVIQDGDICVFRFGV